ncbi:hypothetical protein ACOZ38_25660 [Sphaerisporangium viridialbum]|uniref:hypothetical protein n=1 Tax=Sphaerisporangium viridialbum TaxID=46189 RepID=UPI003C727753
MTTTTAPSDNDTAVIAEKLLDMLRLVNWAQDQTLARADNVYGEVEEALILAICQANPEPFRWNREMARTAIDHAMLDGCSLRQAMYATQTG